MGKMKIRYKQNGAATIVKFAGLEGASICRPEDKFDPELGFFIAFLKMGRSIPGDTLADIDSLPPGTWPTVEIDDDEAKALMAALLAYNGMPKATDSLIKKLSKTRRPLYIERFAQDLKRKLAWQL